MKLFRMMAMLLLSGFANADYVHVLGVGPTAQVKSNGTSSQSVSASTTSVSTFLGGGFFSDYETFGSQTCLNGSEIIDNPGNTKSEISFDSNYNYSHLASNIAFKVNGSASVKWFSGSSEFEFSKLSEETNTSATLIFTFKYLAEPKRFLVNDSSSLNARGLNALSEGSSAFYRVCGDSFVSQINRGGMLNLLIKLDFASESLKSNYKAYSTGKFSDFASVSASLSAVQEKYKENLKVYITANQVGGDASALADLLNVVDGGAVKNCTGTTCLNIIDGLSEYVKSGGVLASSWKSSPAVLGAITSKYSDVIVAVPGYGGMLTQNHIAARKNLFQSLMQQKAYMAKIDSVLSTAFTPVVQSRWNALFPVYQDIKASVERNMDSIFYAQDTCYSYLPNCESASINAISGLEVIEFPRDPSAVYYQGELNIYKSGHETYCVAPESSVLVGVGARVNNGDVKGVKIGYKILTADGRLGSTQYIQCGSGVEKYVEVPEGYVITGVQARASNDNLAAVSAFSRKWDTNLRTLIGDTIISKNGNNYEMSIDLRTVMTSGIFYDTDHVVLNGIGFSVTSDNISGMTGRIGWMY